MGLIKGGYWQVSVWIISNCQTYFFTTTDLNLEFPSHVLRLLLILLHLLLGLPHLLLEDIEKVATLDLCHDCWTDCAGSAHSTDWLGVSMLTWTQLACPAPTPTRPPLPKILVAVGVRENCGGDERTTITTSHPRMRPNLADSNNMWWWLMRPQNSSCDGELLTRGLQPAESETCRNTAITRGGHVRSLSLLSRHWGTLGDMSLSSCRSTTQTQLYSNSNQRDTINLRVCD